MTEKLPDQNSDPKIDVEEHIGLVHLCAKRFSGKGMEYDDLFQAGCVGLMKAASNFDPKLGNQFSTYAVPVILGEIKGLFRTGSIVKVSRGMWELSRQAQQEMEQLREQTGENPSVSQVANRLGISVEKTVLALGVTRAPISLTAGDETAQLEIPVEAPEVQMTDRMTLYQVMQNLDDKDQTLLAYRYFQNKTQQETAKLLDMTQVQVSRREKKLLLYMRSLM